METGNEVFEFRIVYLPDEGGVSGGRTCCPLDEASHAELVSLRLRTYSERGVVGEDALAVKVFHVHPQLVLLGLCEEVHRLQAWRIDVGTVVTPRAEPLSRRLLKIPI